MPYSGQLDDTPRMLPLFRPAVQGFLASLFALDPARLAAGLLGKPLLVLQGGRDLQVGMVDAQRLHAAAPNARLLVLPEVNLVLKRVEVDGPAAHLATYADPHLPLAPGVVEGVADFFLPTTGGMRAPSPRVESRSFRRRRWTAAPRPGACATWRPAPQARSAR